MDSGRIKRWTGADVCALLLPGCATPPPAPKPDATAPAAAHPPLTLRDVDAAQQAWCDGLLGIAKAHAEGRDYESLARAVLSNNYNYDYSIVA